MQRQKDLFFILLAGQMEVKNRNVLWAPSLTPRAVCMSPEGSWKLPALIVPQQKVLWTSKSDRLGFMPQPCWKAEWVLWP